MHVLKICSLNDTMCICPWFSGSTHTCHVWSAQSLSSIFLICSQSWLPWSWTPANCIQQNCCCLITNFVLPTRNKSIELQIVFVLSKDPSSTGRTAFLHIHIPSNTWSCSMIVTFFSMSSLDSYSTAWKIQAKALKMCCETVGVSEDLWIHVSNPLAGNVWASQCESLSERFLLIPAGTLPQNEKKPRPSDAIMMMLGHWALAVIIIIGSCPDQA